MLLKNLDFVWLKEFHQVLESTSEPRNGFVRKNLREPDPEPAKKNLVSFKSEPGTARKFELVLEPDPEAPENLNQF